ncbi:hypothetical protein EMA8858_03892 [Emticicia aquatica]|uniref:Thrombospondin type 3 repeat-containing protein n=1 Tax=Emticicia aquatica TaxID=1681835 RepID=A0ABN8F3D9_9BACT|nr:hypothetical protein [Emticicia aquatica]CAH0997758.1 hypothetical protein EMA8858_03892 [Emticicia aquatica]
MKQNTHLKVCLIAILFLVSIGTSFAQITLSLRYVGSDNKYHLYLKPTTVVSGANPYLTDGSTTITVTAPTGSISISNVSSVSPAGLWSLSTIAINNGDVSSGAPANTDFFVFTPAGDFSSILYTSGVEVELFNFSVVGSCNGSLNILPSTGQTAKLGTLNIGSYYSVLGYNLGIGTNHFNGTYDMISGCPLDTDGDLVLDSIDLDDDNDGILDTVEDGQLSADTDADSVPNRLDLDSDNDGINDVLEAGGIDLNKDGLADGVPNGVGIPSSAGSGDSLVGDDFDGDARPNPYDLDSDNDGINDLVESGNITLVDVNKDGVVDGTDNDGDGIIGSADANPLRGDLNDPVPLNTDGTLGPNYLDLDSDGDGMTDLSESGILNPTLLDTNGDGKIDNTFDSDNDGIPQTVDGLPTVYGDTSNPVLPDVDGDGIPDYIDQFVLLVDTDGDSVPDSVDLDDDNDGILDTIENAACSSASENCDTDGDGIPNRIDLDSDADNIKDVVEAGGIDVDNDGKIGTGNPSVNPQGVPVLANTGSGLTPPDTDSDSKRNPYDADSDNDGISDLTEGSKDTDSDEIPNYTDTDSDNDGIPDSVESTSDLDTDGKPNYLDTDSDSDGIPDSIEGITDIDTDGKPNYLDLDSDGDTIPDIIEGNIDTDSDGKPDYLDLDSDADGVLDITDQCRLVKGISPTGCPANTASIQIKMLLQGAMFNTTDGLMRDELRAKGVVPSSEPYTAFASARFTHKSDGGGETIGSGVTNIIGANAIVDWVFIELRDAANPANVIKTKSALLQRDGDVVESNDGVSPVKFTDVAGLSFYVAIKHRNHLGAMTANPIAIAATGTIVDFTTMTSAQIWNSTANYDGYEQVGNVVGSGKKALWAGNTDANNKVKYVGPANDQSIIFSQVLEYAGNVSQLYNYDFATPLYIQGDVNMDGKVKYRGSDNDSNYIFGNIVSLYLLNASKLYNYDLLLEQIP